MRDTHKTLVTGTERILEETAGAPGVSVSVTFGPKASVSPNLSPSSGSGDG